MAALLKKQTSSGSIASNSEDQKELFLWRWKDVNRDDITEKLKEYKRFDLANNGELEENNAMRLLESRGETKTATELRAILNSIDFNNNHKLSFLEWCCYLYSKSYEETNNFVNEEAQALALLEIQKAKDAAAAVEAEIQRRKAEDEAAAAERAAELERESQLSGVAGMSAFFKRQIENSGDVTMTNEQRIKHEANERRRLREAKQREKEAAEAVAKGAKTEAQVAEELRIAKEKADAEAAAIAEQQAAEERAARAARKEALNAKWGGGGPK